MFYARRPQTRAKQDTRNQQDQLKDAGVETLFTDTASGADYKRPQLMKLLKVIGEGDRLTVTALDRLARSTADLFHIATQLEEKGAALVSLREPWADTTTAQGRFLFTIFAGLAELERNLINNRTQEGREAARKRGVKFGRKPALTTHQQAEALKLLKDGHPIRQVARLFNVGSSTIHRLKVRAIALFLLP